MSNEQDKQNNGVTQKNAEEESAKKDDYPATMPELTAGALVTEQETTAEVQPVNTEAPPVTQAETAEAAAETAEVPPVKKKRSVGYIIVTVITLLILAVAVAVFVVVMIARSQNKDATFFGYSFAVVVTDSMEPEIKTGSLIVIKKCDISEDMVGQNVVFISLSGSLEGERIVHKAIESGYDEDGELYLVTKGVGNLIADDDHVTADNFIGVCVATSYAAGQVVTFLANYGVPLAIAAIALPVIVRLVIRIVKTARSSDDEDE